MLILSWDRMTKTPVRAKTIHWVSMTWANAVKYIRVGSVAAANGTASRRASVTR